MEDVVHYANLLVDGIFSSDFRIMLDAATLTHSYRVCNISALLADKLQFPIPTQVDIAAGALLHDLGKYNLDPNILNKESTLSVNERSLLTLHPILGYQVIKDMRFNNLIKDIVLKHHERLDGSGYPSRIYGNNIPIGVQIVSVADIFSAMTEYRIYHEPKPATEAISTMESLSGLNPLIIAVLKDNLELIKDPLHYSAHKGGFQ